MSKKKRKFKGRPPLRSVRSDYRLSVRLTPIEEVILKEYAWRYEQSPSDVVRNALAILGIIPDWVTSDK